MAVTVCIKYHDIALAELNDFPKKILLTNISEENVFWFFLKKNAIFILFFEN